MLDVSSIFFGWEESWGRHRSANVGCMVTVISSRFVISAHRPAPRIFPGAPTAPVLLAPGTAQVLRMRAAIPVDSCKLGHRYDSSVLYGNHYHLLLGAPNRSSPTCAKSRLDQTTRRLDRLRHYSRYREPRRTFLAASMEPRVFAQALTPRRRISGSTSHPEIQVVPKLFSVATVRRGHVLRHTIHSAPQQNPTQAGLAFAVTTAATKVCTRAPVFCTIANHLCGRSTSYQKRSFGRPSESGVAWRVNWFWEPLRGG